MKGALAIFQETEGALTREQLNHVSGVLRPLASSEVRDDIQLGFYGDASRQDQEAMLFNALEFAQHGLGARLHEVMNTMIMAIDHVVDDPRTDVAALFRATPQEALKAMMVHPEASLSVWDVMQDMAWVFNLVPEAVEAYAVLLLEQTKAMALLANAREHQDILADREALVKANMRISVTSGLLTADDFHAEKALNLMEEIRKEGIDAQVSRLIQYAQEHGKGGGQQGNMVTRRLVGQIKDDVEDLLIDMKAERDGGGLTTNFLLYLLEREGVTRSMLEQALVQHMEGDQAIGLRELRLIQVGEKTLADQIDGVLAGYGISLGEGICMQPHDGFSLAQERSSTGAPGVLVKQPDINIAMTAEAEASIGRLVGLGG